MTTYPMMPKEPGVYDEDNVLGPVCFLFRLPPVNFGGVGRSHLFAAPFSFSCLQIFTPLSTPSG
jgi:hypothetical protein